MAVDSTEGGAEVSDLTFTSQDLDPSSSSVEKGSQSRREGSSQLQSQLSGETTLGSLEVTAAERLVHTVMQC